MDDDVVKVMEACKATGVTVHVRGTDDRPVIEFKDKRTRRVVGGIELRKRLEGAG